MHSFKNNSDCVFTSLCRYKAITAAALASLESQKETEKAAALAALRAELRGEIEAAHRERDEHLENYSKVQCGVFEQTCFSSVS